MRKLRMIKRIVRVAKVFCILAFLLVFQGCEKVVMIPNPTSSVTANQIFSSDETATFAMLGIYSYMANPNSPSFSNVQATYLVGESADELTDQTPGNESYDNYLSNTLSSQLNSASTLQNFWQPAYFDIFSANAIISGVQSSTAISKSTRSQLIGEAKFIRAFCYFYLTNLFGAIPLALSPDFNQTSLLSNSSQGSVYRQIIADLQDAQASMIKNFSLTNGQPIRANSWAATALLARVYLYLGNWAGADSAATAVINSGLFRLVGNLDSVFLANSSEAILQLQTPIAPPYATGEGNFFVPFDSNSYANCWLTTQVLNTFEPGDLRRVEWVDSTDAGGVYYYYPFKYKVMTGSVSNISENYTLLRLAEQILIRAEAEANLGQIVPSLNDINTIRSRAGLDSLSNPYTQSQLISAIQHENRVEFFAEWGHRWLDLKRWGIALQSLDTISYKVGNIDSIQLLYPIPFSELQVDPNLVQNTGY